MYIFEIPNYVTCRISAFFLTHKRCDTIQFYTSSKGHQTHIFKLCMAIHSHLIYFLFQLT